MDFTTLGIVGQKSATSKSEVFYSLVSNKATGFFVSMSYSAFGVPNLVFNHVIKIPTTHTRYNNLASVFSTPPNSSR